jgi:hypothetical protein
MSGDPFDDIPSADPADDDDTPWADPAIRTDYEAALGRFILAFNEVDYRISQVIGAELTRRGRSDLGGTASKGQFAQRLETLAILATSKDGELGAIPVARLRSLNTDRNALAHGHFDQNPYDGSYWVVLKEKARDYPIQRVLALASELTQIAEQLYRTEVFYDFEDLDAKDGV